MEKKWLIIIAILILLILAVSFIIIWKTRTVAAEEELEECKTLWFSGQGKINLVFFSDKNTAEKYMDSLLEIEPYKQNKNEFNFYYIDTYTPECEIYKGIALLCYSKEIIRKAGSCPNDYIVIIKDEKREIRSSSYMNVLSINSKHPTTVLPHEFGHAFANLADEYVPAKLPRGAKNCVNDCEKFQYDTDGCYEGCSKESYFRSINNGIMRTLQSRLYGKFNVMLILDKIKKETGSEVTATGQVIQDTTDCSKKQYYLITGNYDSGEINLVEKGIKKGCIGENGAGNFDYQIIMQDKSVTTTGEFNPELIFTDAEDKEGENQIDGEVFENEGEFILKIPIITNSDTLEISLEGQKIIEINLWDIGLRPCKK